MSEFWGIGHRPLVHSREEDSIRKLALGEPALRVLAKTRSTVAAVGYSIELLHSMSLGPGTFGGSIISDKVSAKHMINIKRLAFETRPINQPEGLEAEPAKPTEPKPDIKPAISHNIPIPKPTPAPARSWLEEIDERIRLKAGNMPMYKPGQRPGKKSETLGSGISEEEVDRIIKEFSRR